MNDNKNNVLKENLVIIRKSLNLSRSQLSKKLNIPYSTLRVWESRNIEYTPKVLKRILKSFKNIGINIDSNLLQTKKVLEPYQLNDKENIMYENVKQAVHAFDNIEKIYVAFMDITEKFITANNSYEKLLNIPVENLIGIHIKDVIGDTGYELCKPYIDKVLLGNEIEFVYPWNYKDINVIILRLKYTPIFFSENKKLLGYLSVVTHYDISSTVPEVNKNNKFKDNMFCTCMNLISKIFSDLKIVKDNNYLKILETVYLNHYNKDQIDSNYILNLVKDLLTQGLLQNEL